MKIFLLLLLVFLANALTATCKLSKDPKATLSLNGTVVFIQDSSSNITRISYAIDGLKPKSQHGIHVHQFGLIDGGCANTGAHFNPHDKTHGSLNSWVRHIGDMGNLVSDDNGKSMGSVSTWNLGLFGDNSVIGRGLVVVALYLLSISEWTTWDLGTLMPLWQTGTLGLVKHAVSSASQNDLFRIHIRKLKSSVSKYCKPLETGYRFIRLQNR